MAPTTVVIGLNWVGDNILALPTYRALHHRFHHEGGIAIAAPPNVAGVLAASASCGRVIAWGASTRDRVDLLRRHRFERAVILPNSFRAAAVAFAARIRERWGYSTDCRSILLTHAIDRGDRGHQLDDYTGLLAALNAPRVVDALPEVSLPVELRDRIRNRLRARGVRFRRPVVGIHPGGLYGPAKHWGDEKYCELAERLRVDGCEILLLTSPSERMQAMGIAAACNGTPIFGESGDVLDLAAAISHCSIVVTNDSGPLHLAAALAVPSVSIFGPTDPARTVIPGASRVIRHTVACQPCYARQCPLGHHDCMRRVAVDEVHQGVLSLLSELDMKLPSRIVPMRAAANRAEV